MHMLSKRSSIYVLMAAALLAWGSASGFAGGTQKYTTPVLTMTGMDAPHETQKFKTPVLTMTGMNAPDEPFQTQKYTTPVLTMTGLDAKDERIASLDFDDEVMSVTSKGIADKLGKPKLTRAEKTVTRTSKKDLWEKMDDDDQEDSETKVVKRSAERTAVRKKVASERKKDPTLKRMTAKQSDEPQTERSQAARTIER